jgi:hypothetical protein
MKAGARNVIHVRTKGFVVHRRALYFAFAKEFCWVGGDQFIPRRFATNTINPRKPLTEFFYLPYSQQLDFMQHLDPSDQVRESANWVSKVTRAACTWFAYMVCVHEYRTFCILIVYQTEFNPTRNDLERPRCLPRRPDFTHTGNANGMQNHHCWAGAQAIHIANDRNMFAMGNFIKMDAKQCRFSKGCKPNIIPMLPGDRTHYILTN